MTDSRGKRADDPPDVVKFRMRLLEGYMLPHSYSTLLGLDEQEPLGLFGLVEKGLSFRTLERFQRNTALSTKELAELIQIPLRTLNRRKEEGKLQPDESDRLLRASRIFGKTLELFEGDVDAARSWLSTPQPAFGGALPLTLARTDVGEREVENLIGRLQYGIPS